MVLGRSWGRDAGLVPASARRASGPGAGVGAEHAVRVLLVPRRLVVAEVVVRGHPLLPVVFGKVHRLALVGLPRGVPVVGDPYPVVAGLVGRDAEEPQARAAERVVRPPEVPREGRPVAIVGLIPFPGDGLP